MLTFHECHALNPFLPLLAGLRPLFNPNDARIVRDVFNWSHARERLEIERAALADVEPTFEADYAEHHRQIDLHHAQFMKAKDSPTLRAISQKHIDAHSLALSRMDRTARLVVAQRRVGKAEDKLQQAAGVLEDLAHSMARPSAASRAKLTMVDVLAPV